MSEDHPALNNLVKRAQQIVTIAAAVAILGGASLLITNNIGFREKVAEWSGATQLREQVVNLQGDMTRLTAALEKTAAVLRGVSMNVDNLSNIHTLNSEPAIRFVEEGSRISDSDNSGIVRFTVRFVKLRNCGRPDIVGWFRNGGGVIHAFRDLSVISPNGRGFSMDAAPNDIITNSFTARIPNDEGVLPGRATGWIEVGPYSACPNSPVVKSPTAPFEILENASLMPHSRDLQERQ